MSDWKLYTMESGIQSIENATLEQQSFHRMQIFLKSYFKDRMIEKEQVKQSFIYHLIEALKKDSNFKKEQDTSKNKFQFEVDGIPLCMSYTDGGILEIIALDINGNRVIKELALKFRKENYWI